MAVTELIVLIAFFAVLLPLGRAMVRRVEDSEGRRIEGGNGSDRVGDASSTQEIAELRRQVARLSERVEKLGEEQDFLVRLLEERPAIGAPDKHETRSSGS